MRALSVALLAACLVGGAASTSRAAPPRASGEAWIQRHRPSRGLVELGVHAGAFLPRDHELFDPRRAYEPLRRVAPAFGARLAYYPLAFLGAELESAAMPGRAATSGEPATIVALRAHAIAQLPYRLAPFALVGLGAMIQTSRRLGSDVDPVLHYGGGLKLFLHRMIALRLELRANATGRHGQVSGRTHHLEALLGVSLTLGRPPPTRPRAPAPATACTEPGRAGCTRPGVRPPAPVLEATSPDPAGAPPPATRPEGPSP